MSFAVETVASSTSKNMYFDDENNEGPQDVEYGNLDPEKEKMMSVKIDPHLCMDLPTFKFFYVLKTHG